jgi:hypothetical protein
VAIEFPLLGGAELVVYTRRQPARSRRAVVLALGRKHPAPPGALLAVVRT